MNTGKNSIFAVFVLEDSFLTQSNAPGQLQPRLGRARAIFNISFLYDSEL